MVKSKPLVYYKIGYDPDTKKKSKSIEVENNNATRTFAIPIVSGDKPIEFQVNEQLPIYHDLSSELSYTGVQKFEKFGNYLSGAFQSAWDNEIAANFALNNQRTAPGFLRALKNTWRRFYGQQDLRKAGLDLIRSKLKWKKIHGKYKHTPVKFTQRVETLYALLAQLDANPGMTPMPTD